MYSPQFKVRTRYLLITKDNITSISKFVYQLIFLVKYKFYERLHKLAENLHFIAAFRIYCNYTAK